MSLRDKLSAYVADTFSDRWTQREGRIVPDADGLKLGSNDALTLDGTVLYADLDGSTALVDAYPDYFAAEVYKTYLNCAARILEDLGGTISAYDGDRVMAIFIGGSKNTNAVKAGLRINWAVHNIINPALKLQYPDVMYQVRSVVGIDTSKLFVTRTGVRGSNDLVWVGSAANHAAKLTAIPVEGPTWITEAVFNRINDVVRTKDGRAIWEKRTWTQMDDRTIYRSTWWQTIT